MAESKIPEVVQEALKKKLENSFLSSVILSWPLSNYKLLVVIFGYESFQSKIFYIDTVLYGGDAIEYYSHLLLIPILVGLFFVFFFPFISGIFDRVVERADNLNKRKILAIQRKKVFPAEEQAAYFSEYDKEKKAMSEALTLTTEKYSVLEAAKKSALVLNANRLKENVLRRFSSSDFDSKRYLGLCQFLSGNVAPQDIPASLPQYDKNWIKDHPITVKLITFIRHYTKKIEGKHEDITVIQADIQEITQVDDLEYFIELLYAFDILDVRNEGDSKVYIVRAVNIITNGGKWLNDL